MADETNPNPPGGSDGHTGASADNGAASWESTNPYLRSGPQQPDEQGSASSSPLGAYGMKDDSSGATESPNGESEHEAASGAADEQVTDLSNPYASSSNPYEQTSSAPAGGDPLAQGSATSAPAAGPASATSPYGQPDPAASPYGQSAPTSSTNPYQPDPSQAAPPQAAPNPYAQPGPAAYGQAAPPQAQPAPYGHYPQQMPYGAQPYTPMAAQTGGGPNILGIISLIVGGLGVLLILIGGVAIFFGFIGVVLGVLGLTLPKFKSKKGLALAGTIVSSVALLGGIASLILVNVLIGTATSTLSDYDSADYPVTVVMTVTTSTSSPVDIDYNIDNGSSGENGYETSDALFAEPSPWEHTAEMNLNSTGYDSSSINLSVDTDNYDETVSCEITVNDKVIASESAQGYASCSVYGMYAYISGSTP